MMPSSVTTLSVADRDVCPPMPFTNDELVGYVHSLPVGKTTGISALSNEFLKHLVEDDLGLNFLLYHLNVLRDTGELPQDYHDSFVCLVHKRLQITAPSDYRPICLMESLTKLFFGLLLQRLRPTWSVPTCQLGSVKGGQALDALWTAQTFMSKESMSGHRSVWVSLDVKQAFDSTSRVALGRLLMNHATPLHTREARRLFQIICSSKLSFQWRDNQWRIDTTSGVPQGAPFSSAIFSYLLGEEIQNLFHKWQSAGWKVNHEDANGFPIFGWLYVDDILLLLQDVQQAKKGIEEISRILQSLGLQLNLDKTQVICHPADMSRCRTACTTHALLPACEWTTCGKYLRKLLGFFDPHNPSAQLHHRFWACATSATHAGLEGLSSILKHCRWYLSEQAVALINRHVFSKWAWYAPFLEGFVQRTIRINTFQVTIVSKNSSFTHSCLCQ